MKRFSVAAAQGQRTDILGIERLPAHRDLWLLRVVGAMRLWRVRAQNLRSVLAEPLFALGEVNLQTVEAGEVPCGTREWYPPSLVDTQNIPVHPRAFPVGRAHRAKRRVQRIRGAGPPLTVVLAADGE